MHTLFDVQALSTRALYAIAAASLALTACGADPNASDQSQNSPARADFETADFVHDVSDVPVDEAIRYGRLDNGMRYAILQNDTPTGTAALRLILDVGSLAESEDQRGLAHFIEHMAFNGTTHVPEGEMVPLLERYGLAFGADSNAFTGQEVVGYLLNLPSVEEEIVDIGLFLLRETASEMTFTPEAIERERGVIVGEERARNTPVSRFFEAYSRFHYPNTIIPDRSPIGTLEVINTAERDLFVDYYERFYTPERAMLVVVGDIDPDQIEAKIRDGFDISIEGLDIDRVDGFSTWQSPENAGLDPDLGVFDGLDKMEFGFFYDPDIYTLIMVDVLSAGEPELDTRATRLEKLHRNLANAIVKRRLDRLINSGQSPLVQADISYSNQYDSVNNAEIFAVSTPINWRDGVAVVENELRRALEYGFTQGELDEQLANLRTSLRDGADQADTRETRDLTEVIWQSWLGGSVVIHPQFALDWFETVEDTITLATLERSFSEMWEANPPKVFVSLNQDLDDGPAAVKEAWRAAGALPVDPPVDEGVQTFAYTDFGPAGTVETQGEIDDLGVTQIVFDNQVKLNVKPTTFEDGVVYVRVDFGAGDLTDQPTAAAGTLLGAAFGGGGLEAHDRDALQRLLAGRSVGYGLGVGQDSFFFASNTTPTDFELQMQVLTAFMTAPGWRDDGLNQFRAISEEIRRGHNAQAMLVASNQAIRVVHGDDARWGFPTAEEFDAFTMDHARAMLEPALKNAPIEITIVGDITVEDASEVVAGTFGALPMRNADWSYDAANKQVQFPEANPEPKVIQFNGLPYQGMANIYYPTGGGEDVTRLRELTLLREVYDLKAVDVFREREGATYSTVVSGRFSRVLDDFGFLWVGVDVDISDVDRMYEIANQIAVEMGSGGISEDELQRARQPILERLEEQREANEYWVSALARSQTKPQRLEDIRSARDDYLAISVESLTALSAEVLRPETAYRISILPQPEADSG